VECGGAAWGPGGAKLYTKRGPTLQAPAKMRVPKKVKSMKSKYDGIARAESDLSSVRTSTCGIHHRQGDEGSVDSAPSNSNTARGHATFVPRKYRLILRRRREEVEAMSSTSVPAAFCSR
jgi:hypothetical protein